MKYFDLEDVLIPKHPQIRGCSQTLVQLFSHTPLCSCPLEEYESRTCNTLAFVKSQMNCVIHTAHYMQSTLNCTILMYTHKYP